MANTYTSLFYHIVFSTKNRERYLLESIQQRVWQYIGGIARENNMSALTVGGVSDHVHVLLKMRPTQTVSKAVQLLKGGSSKWIHEAIPRMKKFAWQDGYGAFTVCPQHVEGVRQYILNQKEHHRRKTFQEEYLKLLKEHGIEYDERYLWD